MVTIVNLKIKSNPITGDCSASLQISRDGIVIYDWEDAALPNLIDLENHYKQWWQGLIKLSSRSHDDDYDDIHINHKIVTNRSTVEGVEACRKYAKLVEEKMQAWLKTPVDSRWQNMRETLVRELGNSQDEVHIFIKSDSALWKFPWHQWDLIENKPHIGVLFSFINSDAGKIRTQYKYHKKVRILAVFGDDINIDLNPDRQVFEKLKDADIAFLDKPNAEEFKKKVRLSEGWDILFFAGHGEIKNETGRIYLNEDEYLEIYDFKNSLKEAIANGLRIAVFNSCEGVGLIEDLATLGLPVAIFMQEKVPDKVAQFFLKEFLSEYVGGKSLYEAFNLARNRLEDKSHDIPGVTLIPKLNQNSPKLAPTWQELQGGNKRSNSIDPDDYGGSEAFGIAVDSKLNKGKKRTVFKTILISLLVTTAVMGLRWFGFLQTSELQAFDRLMQQRPAENADPRILIVAANEADIEQHGDPLPDKIIAATLDRIQQSQPLVIGLDIFRDITTPKEPKPIELISHFQHNPKLISVCQYSENEEERVAPPPQSLANAVGFVNVMLDKPDDTVRRYPLTRSDNLDSSLDKCKTKTSLGFLIAYQYLLTNHIPYYVDHEENIHIGSVVLKRVKSYSSGYQKIDDKGYQILINYRASRHLNRNIARLVTIREILSTEFDSNWIKNKIILVGATAPSLKDLHLTPFDEKIAGVWIHAHVISQILSAVEDGRPLIGWLPVWGDILWIELWSLMAGILFIYWQVKRSLGAWHLILGMTILLVVLYSLCVLAFVIQSTWLPLIPSALAVVASSSIAAIYFLSSTRKIH